MTKTLIIASCLATSFTVSAQKESLTPYADTSEVPQTALDLWKNYDPRKEDLEVKVHHEWKEEGVVSRLITFKVGHFKGSDARIAAYYCFPRQRQKKSRLCLEPWRHPAGTTQSRPLFCHSRIRHRGHQLAGATTRNTTRSRQHLGNPLGKSRPCSWKEILPSWLSR